MTRTRGTTTRPLLVQLLALLLLLLALSSSSSSSHYFFVVALSSSSSSSSSYSRGVVAPSSLDLDSSSSSATPRRREPLLPPPPPPAAAAAAHPERRDVLSSLVAVLPSASSFAALLLQLLPSPTPANAGLLDEYGADVLVDESTTKDKEKKKEKKRELAKDKGKPESNVEPNLRSNYYYPTNKVRYLPRIKKCSDAIPGAAAAIGNGDWDYVLNFASVVADDAILPMKLYVSSLTGGGTNVKVGFAKDMMSSAKSFEMGKTELIKGAYAKDVAKSSTALENIAESMLSYRTSGRLLGPDGGGDIPSVDEIRRSTKRFRGEAYEAKVKERDARVKAAMDEAGVVGK